MDDTLRLTAEMIVGRGRRRALVSEAALLSLAVHAIALACVLGVIQLRPHKAAPEGAVIQVMVETTQRGDPTATVPPVPLPPPPAPASPMAAHRAPAVLRMPARRRSVEAQDSPPQEAVPQAAAQAGQAGIGGRSRPQVVAVTRPAQAAAGNPAPHYPAISRALGEQGKVALRVLVRPDGSVGSVTVIESSGFPRLDRAARDAVLHYRFQPALKAGQPVASFLPYWIEFVLK